MTFPFQFYPALNVINNITQSYPCVVTVVLPVAYQDNEFISIRCPAAFGMTQIDGKTARVMSVNTLANTITLDLDSSGFDAFVFGPPFNQLPQTVPAGEFGITLNTAVRDNTARGGYTPAP